MKKIIFLFLLMAAGLIACAQQPSLTNIWIRNKNPRITLTTTGSTPPVIYFGNISLSSLDGRLTLTGGDFNLNNYNIITAGGGNIGQSNSRFANSYVTNGWFVNGDFQNTPTINGTSIYHNAVFSGTLTVPTPTAASDATTKAYVDSKITLGVTWVSPVEDIVSSLPTGKALGRRYVLSSDKHIYVSDGDNTFTDLGATVTGTTAYVIADSIAGANSVGPYNYNGSAWVSIGALGNHNDMQSIQGGSSGQYYHLTSAQHTFVSNFPAAGTAANLMISDGNNWTSAAVPTWNQNTTGIAAKATILETARGIYGNNFDGSASLSGVIGSVYGGTANGFFKVAGPASTEKTFTFPNVSSTVLTDNASVTVAQGGTGRATGTTAYGLIAAGTTATGAQQTLAAGSSGQFLRSGGAAALPSWSTATIPAVAGTNGNVLTSDGTNWVSSPATGGGDVTTTGTQTLTNKTLTQPKINEDVAVTVTASQLNNITNFTDYTTLVSLKHPLMNAQTGSTYTFQITDDNALVTMNYASACTLVIPSNAAVAFPYSATKYTVIHVANLGAGVLTIDCSAITPISKGGLLSLAQGAGADLVKVAINTWWIVGGLQ